MKRGIIGEVYCHRYYHRQNFLRRQHHLTSLYIFTLWSYNLLATVLILLTVTTRYVLAITKRNKMEAHDGGKVSDQQ